ncbi:MAG: hypothetical protein ACJ8R9_31145 [Steroidobacteraceae bacterium]
MEPFPPIEAQQPVRPLTPFRVSSYLPEEAEALRRLDVWIARMRYDGRFGERQIGNVTYEWLDERPHEVGPDETITESIAVFFRELLELRFPGWETAEGSCGYFEWYLGDDMLTHQHALRVIEYRTVTLSID